MNQPAPKIDLANLVQIMRPEHRRVAEAICEEYAQQMSIVPGSSSKHQTWKGGYISHVEETMNLALIMYHELHKRRPLPFDVSTALFCAFIHDFDKLLRYTVTDNTADLSKRHAKDDGEKVREALLSKYNYSLTSEEYNALKYTHGKGADFQPGGKRVMGPLATLVHCCDVISARIWYDYGRSHNSWRE